MKAPWPGRSSMLWMSVPTGILLSGRALPTSAAVGAAQNGSTYFKAVGGDDVGLCTVYIVEKGDAGRAVGIVLDALYYCGNAVVISLKVDDTVFTLVTTTKVAVGEVAFVVAAAGAFYRL